MIYDENRLKSLLPKEISTVKVYDETDSTSSEARRYAVSGGASSALFLADRQSGGRGRMGRSFFSPEGCGVYLSLLLPLPESSADTVLITSAASVAVRRAILAVTGRSVGIKWVNDLYYNSRKVCGILCEAMAEHRAMIVGIGVNLYPSKLPEEISDIAGAIFETNKGNELREDLAAAIVTELLRILREIRGGEFMDEYRENSIVLGKEIRYVQNGVSHVGVATHIDKYGHLYVRDIQGDTKILSSGEISVKFN